MLRPLFVWDSLKKGAYVIYLNTPEIKIRKLFTNLFIHLLVNLLTYLFIYCALIIVLDPVSLNCSPVTLTYSPVTLNLFDCFS